MKSYKKTPSLCIWVSSVNTYSRRPRCNTTDPENWSTSCVILGFRVFQNCQDVLQNICWICPSAFGWIHSQSESQLPHNWPWKLAAGVEMNCRKIILLPLLDTSLLKPISCTSFHAWYCGEWVVLFLLLFWSLLSLLWNLLSCHILIWSKPGERQCLWGTQGKTSPTWTRLKPTLHSSLSSCSGCCWRKILLI